MSLFPKYPLLVVFLLLPFLGLSQGFTYTISSGGSDYSITVSYDIDAFCRCNDEYSYSVYRNNRLPGNFMGSSGKKKGGVTFNVGPSTNHNYLMDVSVKGRNNAIFECVFPCEGVGDASKRASTAALKPPRSLQASNGEDFITLTWEKGTDLPNSHDDYYIYRDGTESEHYLGAVTGYTFTDEEVGPGETHTYYIRTHTNYFGGHNSSPPTNLIR
jgi:hypothetical protein